MVRKDALVDPELDISSDKNHGAVLVPEVCIPHSPGLFTDSWHDRRASGGVTVTVLRAVGPGAFSGIRIRHTVNSKMSE